MKIGVLDLQGCVEPHRHHIEKLGFEFTKIRYPDDCRGISGYIIPGGESTVIRKLIKINGLHELLVKEWKKKPVWGICAGAILIATKISIAKEFIKANATSKDVGYGLIDCEIIRNAYGSQVMSHFNHINDYEVAFIRAPKIAGCGIDVQILATVDDLPVWVRNEKHMATTFHPELNSSAPSPMHEYFVKCLLKNSN